MKKYTLIITAFLLGLSMGCKKDADKAPMEIVLQNEPPLSFNLVDVPDGAEDVDVTPTLSWESAKNPNGSEVAYDLYLGTDENPTTLFQSDISGISFEVTERLQLLTDYFWKVVAKDPNGQKSQSTIHKFSTRNLNFPETSLTTNAAFSERRGFATTVFDEKMWVVGGTVEGDRKNDVWFSEDGISWTEATANASFSPRVNHTLTVFMDKLWIIGGSSVFETLNDVWSSTDGIIWTEEVASTDFTERTQHSTVVFDDKIWVIAGVGPSLVQDVWSSTNGIDWVSVQEFLPFDTSLRHPVFVFDDKIWLIGGIASYNTDVILLKIVWNTVDGKNWKIVNDSPAFPARIYGSGFVFDDRIWIVGGRDQEGDLLNDIWYSPDGQNWEKARNEAPFSKRQRFETLIFQNKPWILGGLESGDIVKNDVWTLD